jgi:hypothetical protein
MTFCVCGAEDFTEDWQRWDDHPARRDWEVIKDLGAGALSQVRLGAAGGGEAALAATAQLLLSVLWLETDMPACMLLLWVHL